MVARRGLWVASGSAGVTQPQDARLASAGLLSAFGAGPLDAAAGVIYGPGNPCRVTGSSSGPNMKYVVAAGVLATARGTSSDGLYLWANDGAVTIDSSTPAPGSGTRWDLVYARAKNANDGFGDADSDTELGVTVGTAGSPPTKPYGSVPSGALVLAECSVGTSIANASLAGITQVSPWKVARGAPVPVRSQTERDALTQYDALTVSRLDTGKIEQSDGTSWVAFIPATVRHVARSTTLSAAAGSDVPITSWNLAPYNVGDIAYGAGVFTVARTGLYQFDLTISWPTTTTTTHRRSQYVFVNGAETSVQEGRADITITGTNSAVNVVSTGGNIALNAGDTVQAVVSHTFSASLTLSPKVFTLLQVG